MESINPSLPKTITENIKRINETEQLFHYAISLLQKEITEQRKGHFYIHLGKLQASPAPSTLLFEILRPFNFNNNQIAQMIDSIEHQAGPIFFSSSHQVLLDRDFFIIKKNTPIFDQRFIINKNDTQITFPKGQLSLKIKSEKPNFSIKEKQIEYHFY